MYEKQLYGRRVLRFIYAPPFTELDDISPDDTPNPPYKGAKFYECSVYYYWWAFLRENSDYIACCERGGTGKHAELYRDFGDVRADDFFKWWRAGGRELFCETDGGSIEMIANGQLVDVDHDRVILSVPIRKEMEHLVAEFRQLIKPIYAKRRRQNQVSTARYPIHKRPVVTALHTRLTAYHLRKASTEGQMTLVEIGKKLGLYAIDDQQLAILVSKNIREAQALIKNVVQGRFPDTSR